MIVILVILVILVVIILWEHEHGSQTLDWSMGPYVPPKPAVSKTLARHFI